jgi:hypothetical protein
MKKQIMLASFVIALCWPWATPMGDSTQQNVLTEPTFAALEEGEDLLDGTIKDELSTTHVSQLSFFGNTTVGGIRQENNDSVTKLDLSKIKSIKILQASYASKRFPEKDFTLARKTSLEGNVSEEYLIPRHIVICGIDKRTGDEKSWYLNKLDELIVGKPANEPPTPVTAAPTKPRPETIKPVEPIVPAQTTEQTTTAPTAQEKTTVPTEKIHEQAAAPVAVQTASEQAQPITVKEQYTEKEIKFVEKKANDTKSILSALDTLISAIGGFFKAIFNFIKSLFI